MTEADLQKQCNEYLRREGILFYHRERGRYERQMTHSKGWPDLLILYNGRALGVELKMPGKDFRPDQILMAGRFLKAGVGYIRIDNFDDFVVLVKLFKEE